MKTRSIFAGFLLCCGSAQAVQYTEVYDLFQTGYDGGGTVTATIWITEVDGDNLISAGDILRGVIIFRQPAGNGRTNVNGFDITGIAGASLLSGAFTISGMNHLGMPATITNNGGTLESINFPFTGQSTTVSTTQAPVITKRVSDGGSTALLLCLGLMALRSAACRW